MLSLLIFPQRFTFMCTNGHISGLHSSMNTCPLIGGADKQHMLCTPQSTKCHQFIRPKTIFLKNLCQTANLTPSPNIYYCLWPISLKCTKYACVIVWACISISCSSTVFSYKGLFTAWLPLFLLLAVELWQITGSHHPLPSCSLCYQQLHFLTSQLTLQHLSMFLVAALHAIHG